ncbi:hypothetical protein GMOD_00000547 [Pyrenophora seminiperda CCB06]|uniref:Uncharacterized protein n=1 Tax=Pyrenophora seminiperda CCB06 TaxID=1302712 RepID=A0A3M7M7F6_9PLEO|nr:hypothetical protein GMOD_00000547 [Pyrenophora seminiperda CCB06]
MLPVVSQSRETPL